LVISQNGMPLLRALPQSSFHSQDDPPVVLIFPICLSSDLGLLWNFFPRIVFFLLSLTLLRHPVLFDFFVIIVSFLVVFGLEGRLWAMVDSLSPQPRKEEDASP